MMGSNQDSRSSLFRLIPTVALFVLAGAAPVFADPPDRVCRINFLNGTVSFKPAIVEEWTSASINYPLTTGDHLWTEPGSRAELHVGSMAIRLGPGTDFDLLNLDNQTAQIRLVQGSINVRVRSLGEDDVIEVDTPNVAVSLLRQGTYRIDVGRDGEETKVTVRHGEAEITASGYTIPVHPREAALVDGEEDKLTYDLLDAAALDDWDNWCAARDLREDRTASVRYVSHEMCGYEDLDQYGSWRVVSGYGPVWAPRAVVTGWAPYRYGHWAWIEPWGWTWVDDAPWGFAPFHYGRWALIEGSWAWIPGQVVVRPVYAPALVAFIGDGPWRVTLSLGGPGIAWFPLGPREVYVPAYRVSDTYVRRVNVTNVNVTNVNIRNINVTNVNYVNRSAPGAVTAVSHEAFVGGHQITKPVVVPPNAVANVAVVGTSAPLAPRAESVTGRRAAGAQSVAKPPAAVLKRTVVSRVTPPPPPVSFAVKQKALTANSGKPLDEKNTEVHKSAAAHPLVKSAAANSSASGSTKTLKPAREGLVKPQPVRQVKPSSKGKGKTNNKDEDKKKENGKQKEGVNPSDKSSGL